MVALVYLHGVGDGDPTAKWRLQLAKSLNAAGLPDLDAVQVVAPQYADALDRNPSPTAKIPDRTSRKSTPAEHRAYQRERARVETLYGARMARGHDRFTEFHDRGTSIAPGPLVHAKRYIRTEGLRHYIIDRVLKALPTDSDLVVVGHSLGTLVALDILDYLPTDVRVRRLVTLGSPAGHAHMHRASERLLKRFPLHRVGSWVNCWSPLDMVPLGSGVSSTFSHAVDLRVGFPFPRHSGAAYMASSLVAHVIGDALSSQQSRELIRVGHSPEARLDGAERALMLALRYGHILRHSLEDQEARDRFTGALEITQMGVCAQLVQFRERQGRPIPEALSDAAAGGTPAVPQFESPAESVATLLSVAAGNVIAPFEIKVEEATRRAALGRLASLLECPASFGVTVFDALSEAKSVISSRTPWGKLALGAAGLALLAAGPVGLLIAAPAGLAGGAAIVGALSTFGPGGMIGGLMTAGALTSTGMGVAATALASSNTSVAATEAAVLHQLAEAIARRKLGLDPRPEIAAALSLIYAELVAEEQRLTPFSDRNAPGLRAVVEKKRAVERALAYMVDNHVTLTVEAGGPSGGGTESSSMEEYDE